MRRYDATAGIYDGRYAPEQTAKIQAALKHSDVGPKSVVLDAGTGTGLLFSHIANRALQVVGIDISSRSLMQAKRYLNEHRNVQIVQADIDALPFRNSCFTHVFALTVIQNVPQPLKTIAELKRVVMGDGRLVITGLKRIFSRTTFVSILRNSGLRVASLESQDSLECHVAFCTISR